MNLNTIGGKGFNLIVLAQGGFHVPNAFIIREEAFVEFRSDWNCTPELQQGETLTDFHRSICTAKARVQPQSSISAQEVFIHDKKGRRLGHEVQDIEMGNQQVKLPEPNTELAKHPIEQ